MCLISWFSKGAIVGGIVSLMFYLWMAIGNIVLSPPGVEKKLDPAPVDMCSENTTTYTNTTTPLAHGLNITGVAVSTTPAALYVLSTFIYVHLGVCCFTSCSGIFPAIEASLVVGEVLQIFTYAWR